MDFTFSSEQRQLADTVRRFVDHEYGFSARKKVIHSESGIGPKHWDRMVELGLLALPVPEAHGGFAGSAIDMLAVMQELGRGLVIEPYLCTVIGTEFLKRSASGRQSGLLEEVAKGAVKLAPALGERQSRYDLFNVEASAHTTAGPRFILNGTKTVVMHGAQADYLIVSARVSGGSCDPSGVALFLVDARARGVERREYRTVDGQRAADIHFTGVELDESACLADENATGPMLESVIDYGTFLVCAEALGAMDALNAQTLAYTKSRKQFGQPIARFQVLQHRMADMFIHIEQARSLCYLAAANVMSGEPAERIRAVSSAKVRVGQAARYVGQQAIQLHGGMGVTDELPAAHYFKRLSMIEVTFGDTDFHLARFIARSGASTDEVFLRQVA